MRLFEYNKSSETLAPESHTSLTQYIYAILLLWGNGISKIVQFLFYVSFCKWRNLIFQLNFRRTIEMHKNVNYFNAIVITLHFMWVYKLPQTGSDDLIRLDA